MKKINLFILLFLIGFLVYIPSLFGRFFWDDFDFITDNRYVTEMRVDRFFTNDVIAGRGKISNYYRPLQSLTYAAIYKLFGPIPFFYHLTNNLFHTGAAIAIFLFFTEISSNLIISFFIALIFLIHPVQTEAVSYASGLSDPLFAFFGFLSLFFFLKRTKKKYYIFSLIFFILSLLSKELGLVFLGLIFLAWLFEKKRKNILNLLPYALISLIYIAFHLSFINKENIKLSWGNTLYSSSALVRFLTFIHNLFAYIGLIIFPKDLFMERDFSIKIITNPINRYLILFILINVLVVFLIFKIRKKIKHFNLVIFSYLAFFGSFFPVSGIMLINGIFYEHFLYLPTVFFISFLFFIFESFFNKKILIAISFIIGVLIIRSILRQLDWIDPVRFYNQTLEYAPQSWRIRNNLGMAYAEKGDLVSAIKQYNNTIQLNNHIPNPYYNLGNAYLSLGQLATAEGYFKKAIDVDPNFIFSYSSLLNLYRFTNQRTKLEQLINLIHHKFPHLQISLD